MLKKRLGKRISILRKQRKLSQEKLAEKAAYSVEFISMIERGINSPSIEGCERIAKALKIKLKDLFDFEAKPEPALPPFKQTKKKTRRRRSSATS